MEQMKKDAELPEAAEEAVKAAKAPDRICLGRSESAKVESWLRQIENATRGFLTLTKSDIANWAIRAHGDELRPKELSQIRADHYDPIRHIQWILPQIKEALASGDGARVVLLQEELRGVELSVAEQATVALGGNSSTNPRPKRRKKETKDEVAAPGDKPDSNWNTDKGGV